MVHADRFVTIREDFVSAVIPTSAFLAEFDLVLPGSPFARDVLNTDAEVQAHSVLHVRSARGDGGVGAVDN